LHYAEFKSLENSLYKDFLQKTFLSYAKLNKRKKVNKMWISWKLLFKEGGYAFIAFGNDK
jgi:hypothetical protein